MKKESGAIYTEYVIAVMMFAVVFTFSSVALRDAALARAEASAGAVTSTLPCGGMLTADECL